MLAPAWAGTIIPSLRDLVPLCLPHSRQSNLPFKKNGLNIFGHLIQAGRQTTPPSCFLWLVTWPHTEALHVMPLLFLPWCRQAWLPFLKTGMCLGRHWTSCCAVALSISQEEHLIDNSPTPGSGCVWSYCGDGNPMKSTSSHPSFINDSETLCVEVIHSEGSWAGSWKMKIVVATPSEPEPWWNLSHSGECWDISPSSVYWLLERGRRRTCQAVTIVGVWWHCFSLCAGRLKEWRWGKCLGVAQHCKFWKEGENDVITVKNPSKPSQYLYMSCPWK